MADTLPTGYEGTAPEADDGDVVEALTPVDEDDPTTMPESLSDSGDGSEADRLDQAIDAPLPEDEREPES